MHLGFENRTADKQELHGHRAQAPSVEGPCGTYADPNEEDVQFKSSSLAKVTNTITIAVWVRLQSISGIQPILVLTREATELRFELVEGHVTWLYSGTRPSLATFALLSRTPVVSENLWTHLVVNYDARTRLSAVFLNGKRTLQGKSNGGSLELPWGKRTTIGKYSINEVLELKLNGFMDEFYIYYCSIPEMVIQRLAQECRVDGKCAPVIPGNCTSSETMGR